ncbi:MAG: hypothetical protein OXD36_09515, partial [Rhodobacter sp.]|nr:hypothetical protein [Rhodobacter sp.]
LDDDNKATYSGTATGLSVRETGSGDSAVSHSGHFTADMKLNASFGDTSTLVGTVRNFQPVSGQGTAHVNTGWALDLEGTGFTGGGFKENGPTGTWTAQAYGGSVTDGEQARPTGVYGTVNAAFSDGAAAGVYHTAKD